jgi:hypothetical protein
MKRILAIALAVVLIASTGQTSNQALSHQDVIDNVAAGNLIWISGQPGGWSGSNQLTTRAEFVANVKNSGSCPGSSAQILAYGDMVSCRVLTSVHTPILANYTFAAGSFSSWSASGSGCTTGTTALHGVNATGQDGTGYAAGDSGTTCNDNTGTFATLKASQTFTIVGTPTTQSFSFWYLANLTTQGDARCGVDSSSVQAIRLTVNGTTVLTDSAPTVNSTWIHETGTTSGLVSGSNTVTIEADVLAGARGMNYVTGPDDCEIVDPIATQDFAVDNVELTATY